MSDVYGSGLWGDAPVTANERELETRRYERPASGAARTRAVMGSASEWLSFNLASEGLQNAAQSTNPIDIMFMLAGEPIQQRLIEPEELNRRYGIEGALSFDRPASESWAAHRYERTRRELFRQDVISRAQDGSALTDFGLALSVGLADPINVIFPFGRINSLRAAMPGLAAWEAGEQVLPRVAARSIFGAGEGAIYSTAVEPLFYGMAHQAERDYGFEQSLINVLAGAGLGGVINGTLGIFSRGSPDAVVDRALMPRVVREASPEAREAAMSEAVAAAADGRESRAGEIFDTIRQTREAELAAFAQGQGRGIRHAPIRETEVFTPAGGRERAIYALVEIEDLVTSNTDELAIEPRYPQALQPRDRTRAASEAQLAQFGAPFEASRWGETFQGDAGAPVAGTDGAVESGNARTIWMRRAYRSNDPRAKAYRDWLAAQNYPVEGFKFPLLVRLTDASRDVGARVRFAEELNKPASALMSAGETAFADARRLSIDTLSLHQGGAIGAADNVSFTRDAMGRLTSEAERGAMIDAEGRLSQAGERRLEAALMARAYGDEALIEMRFETLDDELKTVGGALADAAPAMARLAARIDAGEVSREFDLRAPLQAATAVLREARRRGKSVKSYLRELAEQGDMFDAGLSARTLDMLQLLVDNGTRVRARAKIAAGLDVYARAAEASPAPVMFDEARIDYGKALEASGRAAGDSELRARDGGGAESGGSRSDASGAPADRRLRDSRDAVAANLERQLEGRYGDDAKAIARVGANMAANIGAHYGETAEDVVRAIGLRIEGGAAEGAGRRMAQLSERTAPRRVIDTPQGEVIVNPTQADMMRLTRPQLGKERFRTDELRWIRDADGNVYVARAFDFTHDQIAEAVGGIRDYLPHAVPGDGHGAIVRTGQISRANIMQGQRFPQLPRTMKERRQLRRAIWRADKEVAMAERQATAFLAAVECIAREGFSNAGGRGSAELLAGLALGQAAAIPVGVLAANYAADNENPPLFSAEWIRRARVLGDQLEFPIVPADEADEERYFEGQRVYRTDDDPDWVAPGRNYWEPPEPDDTPGVAGGSVTPEGARISMAVPGEAASSFDQNAEDAALMEAFRPYVEMTVRERQALQDEATAEALLPLVAAARADQRAAERRGQQ